MALFRKDKPTNDSGKNTAKPRKPIFQMNFAECLSLLEESYCLTPALKKDKKVGYRIVELLSRQNHCFESWIMAGGEAFTCLAHDGNLDRKLFYKIAHEFVNRDGSRTVKNKKQFSYRAPDAFQIEYGNQIQKTWTRGAKYQSQIHELLIEERVDFFVVPEIYEAKGHPFYQVHQYIPSKSLMAWSQKCLIKDKFVFFMSLLAAISYIHSTGNEKGGIIHRDLCPANIRVTLDNRPVVTDWGLAKISGEAGVTLTGYGKGKRRTSSLDQLTNAVEASYHNDAYSLAIVLAAILLENEPVIENEDDLMIRSLRDEWLNGIAKQLPKYIRPIFTKATEHEITKRYLTVEQLYNDLYDALVQNKILTLDEKTTGIVYDPSARQTKTTDEDDTAKVIFPADKPLKPPVWQFIEKYIKENCANCSGEHERNICARLIRAVADFVLSLKEEQYL